MVGVAWTVTYTHWDRQHSSTGSHTSMNCFILPPLPVTRGGSLSGLSASYNRQLSESFPSVKGPVSVAH